MGNFQKPVAAIFMIAVLGAAFTACSSGTELENKLVKAFAEINAKWEVYEVKEEGNKLMIKIEVDDVVPFSDAKKALQAIIEINPQATGMIEWYNSQVGMTLRKMEIMPIT